MVCVEEDEESKPIMLATRLTTLSIPAVIDRSSLAAILMKLCEHVVERADEDALRQIASILATIAGSLHEESEGQLSVIVEAFTRERLVAIHSMNN